MILLFFGLTAFSNAVVKGDFPLTRIAGLAFGLGQASAAFMAIWAVGLNQAGPGRTLRRRCV